MPRLAFAVHVVAVLAVAFHVGCSSDDDGAPTSDGGTNDSATKDGESSDDAGEADDDAAAATDSTAAGDGGKKPFGETCKDGSECESGKCFVGSNQSFCSFECTPATAATDCPVPPTSGACNNQGFCRKP